MIVAAAGTVALTVTGAVPVPVPAWATSGLVERAAMASAAAEVARSLRIKSVSFSFSLCE